MLNPQPFPSPIVQPFVTPFSYTNVNTPKVIQQQEPSTPRFVNYLADYSGCGHWRILWPEAVINATGAGSSSSLTSMVFDPRWYTDVKCVKIQRQASTPQKNFVSLLKEIQKEHKFKLIYEVDDVVFREDIPDYNKFKPAFDNDEIRQNCIDIINMCDEVTVTCDFMKRLYQERTGKQEITVVPNFIPYFWLGYLYNPKNVYNSYESNKRKPRILYAGSGAHYDVDNRVQNKDDFEQLIKLVVDTRSKYQWVFMGSYPPPLRKYIEDGSIEFHGWQSLLSYPRALANLNIQLMIAPLQDNNFNRAKSDIKFMEAATLGIPCLCQDMCTYSTAPEYLRFKTTEEFISKAETILNYKNRQNYFKNVEKLHSIGSQRTLEMPENIGAFIEAMTLPYGSPDRKLLSRWN
jgi:hypothetical protein